MVSPKLAMETTRKNVLRVAQALENQTLGSRLIAIELLKQFAETLPEPVHVCECSECAERGEKLIQFKQAAVQLLTLVCPGVVLTIGGREIDHSAINQVRCKLSDLVDDD